MAKLLYITNKDGSEDEISLPIKWEICGVCEGSGMSSAYLGAYTWDEMNEAGEEFIEDYFAGNYDRPCNKCSGSGKVEIADISKLSDAHKKAYEQQCAEDRQYERESQMERMMGA